MSRDLTLTIVFAAAMSILQTSQAANRELVDIAQVDPTIVIDLRYATEHNVTGHALYPPGTRALILPSVGTARRRAKLSQAISLSVENLGRVPAEGGAGAALEVRAKGPIRRESGKRFWLDAFLRRLGRRHVGGRLEPGRKHAYEIRRIHAP